MLLACVDGLDLYLCLCLSRCPPLASHTSASSFSANVPVLGAIDDGGGVVAHTHSSVEALFHGKLLLLQPKKVKWNNSL